MYLSRLILNPRSRQVQIDLAHPYEMHRTIMHAFGSHIARDRERILFRVDDDPRAQRINLLVQSKEPPDWSWLAQPARNYLLPGIEPNPAIKSFDLNVRAGQTLIFRLVANPTKRLGKGMGSDQGKRVGLYREPEQMSWLERKAESAGFRLLHVQIGNHSMARSRIKRDTTVEHRARWLTVRFDGMLQVVKPELFIDTVAKGIGSGKAFGCGMISVAPVR